MTVAVEAMPLDVPEELAASEPPEARGLTRDGVRLMVTRVSEDQVTHTRFDRLPDFLEPGDLLVVNTSATINASFRATRLATSGPRAVEVHLSTHSSGNQWIIELRNVSTEGSSPLLDARAGERLPLSGGGTALLIGPFDAPGARRSGSIRLWVGGLALA